MGILLTQSGGIFSPISKLLGIIMNGIFEFLYWIGIENGSIGISIILFTVIIYTILLPMTIKQQKFTRISAVMNPEIQAIQKKYENKKDQASMAKMQEETKLVYEKYGSSPTSGCLGSLIQLPILFALWPVVQNIPAYVAKIKGVYEPLVNAIVATDGYQKVIEAFAKAKSVRVAESITNNNVIDVLYKFQDADWSSLADKFPKLADLIASTQGNIDKYNHFLGINMAETPSGMFKNAWGADEKDILMIFVAVMIPLLAGFFQWLSARIAQKATVQNNKNNDNNMAKQMNMMMNFMPIMSVVLCFSMPSGLGLYWIVSAVVRTIQQVFVNKSLNKKPIEELIEENRKKAEKKREKKKSVSTEDLNRMAQTNTRRIQDRKTSSDNVVDSYKPDAKPGSLASKANMVRDFNNRNK